MNAYPKVSIITVNYNTTEVTADLLRSLQRITYPNWEVVVIDNGSKEPCRALQQAFPFIRYIEAGANLGFAGGNNKGISVATGDLLLLLNNDTEVAPDFLEPMVARFAANPRIGVVSPKILYFDAPRTIQYAGFSPIHPITGRGFTIGLHEQDCGQYNQARETSRAHGAAMMFSRRAIEAAGLMPEVFFLYYEEMDHCEKFKRAGYTIWYEPASTVWHKESLSAGKNSVLKTYYYSRNRLLYLRRNTMGWQRYVMLLYYLGIAVPKNVAAHLLQMEWRHLNAFCKGLAWNFFHSTADIHDIN